MRKLFLFFLLALLIQARSFAASVPVHKNPLATELMLPIGNSQISLYDFLNLSAKQYKVLSGKKLGVIGAIKFKIAQRRLRKLVSDDGSVEIRKAKGIFDGSDFHTGGYALGLFLGPVGVIVAYLINDDNKERRVKWAWWGFVGFVGVLLAVANASAMSFF